MSRLLLLYFLFLLLSSQILSSSFSFSNSTKLCPHHQTLALLHLKQSFSINNSSSLDCHAVGVTSYPKTESWKKGSDCCSWDGVTCDWVTGHVIELDLSCSWLFGTIHSNTTLFLLPHIQRLNLAFNNFSGSSISVGFGRFSSLTHLNLSDSGFSGLISPEISHLSNLVSLDLSWNSDTEFAPHGFNSLVQNLTKLQKLHLGGISISSVFPNSLLNRSSLISLHLSSCGLHGRFPDHDIHLPKLEVLNLWRNDDLSGNFPRFNENNSLTENLISIGLSNNHFSEMIDLSMNELHGPIPSSIFKLVNLRSLYLSSNNLSGVLETSNFGKLRNLINLYLSNNMLSLTTSSNSNCILPKIESIDLSNNKISGVWSWNMGKDTLWYLNLSYNSISGFEMLPWKNVGILDLHSNLLQGALPTPPNSTFFFSVFHNKLSGGISPLICKVSSIRVLDLSSNNLSGMLPHCLGNFSKDLSVLNLRRNRFHGTIPQSFLKGNVIRNLDFNDNRLEGLVPRSLIICRKLEVLNLGNNKINDTFPHWLGTLPELQVLVLRSNSFHGHIGCSKLKSPFMSLRIIDLAHNDFEGDLPEMYLRSLKVTMNVDEDNMTRKYMGGNYYEDSVMVTIKGLEIEFVKILNAFATIDLSSNKFQGEIPQSIGNLNSLRGLNLSHNNLTGHIPSSFGNLKLLESLDLSSNKLIGSIPQQLTSLIFLEVLNLSQNHLTGFIPKGNQFDTFGNDSYNGNSELCGFPLSKKCIADETPEPSKEEDAEFENKFDWKFMLVGYGCGLVYGLSLGGIIFLIGKPKWFEIHRPAFFLETRELQLKDDLQLM
uniref:Leucine-rich repeat-containing N-terminal plant-type domain-containing protein n=1 Tax=Vitis vinifera TaxID=29760 RepID=F6HRA3_VITVI